MASTAEQKHFAYRLTPEMKARADHIVDTSIFDNRSHFVNYVLHRYFDDLDKRLAKEKKK